MKGIILSATKTHENVLIAITKETYEEITTLYSLARSKEPLPNDGIIDNLEIEVKLHEVVICGESNTIDEETARELIPKRKFYKEEKFTREDKYSDSYYCYAVGKPVIHYGAKSSFKCALEQLGYPPYCLVFLNKLPPLNAPTNNSNPTVHTQG